MSLSQKILIGLLIFIPISIGSQLLHGSALVIFLTSGLAIIPLAAWIGAATEEIAVVVGPSLGGLLNATFGNATELIIAAIALQAGLVEVVKASLTGSIISNLLLVMGFSMLLGGLRFKEQAFQPLIARVNASSMNLAVVAILLPTAIHYTSAGIPASAIENLSIAVAVVLIVVYGLTLLFSMKTHRYLYDLGIASLAPEAQSAVVSTKVQAISTEASGAEKQKSDTEKQKSANKINLKLWVSILLFATIAVAIESELLVNSLEVATEQLNLTSLFTGVILLPIMGNAAEHVTAVTVAMKNKMDLSLSVAVGSSMQIALFVAPVLVLAGWGMGQPMDLDFNLFELVAVAVAVFLANSISSDGKSNWLEGVLLLATYTILGFAFYFHPA